MSSAMEAALISRTEALEGQLKATEERVAFERREVEDRKVERDEWRKKAEKADERIAALERDLTEQTERAQRFGLMCHRLEQDAVGLRRRAEAAETNLGLLAASKNVIVFSGELGDFTDALVDVVERLKTRSVEAAPPLESEPEAAQ